MVKVNLLLKNQIPVFSSHLRFRFRTITMKLIYKQVIFLGIHGKGCFNLNFDTLGHPITAIFHGDIHG